MKPYLTNNRRKSNRSKVIILILTLVIIVAVILGAKALRNRDNTPAVPDNSTEAINYAPATEEEKRQTDQHKESLAKQQEAEQDQQPSSTTEKKAVTPIITGAGQIDDDIEVRAYVPSIVEDGGKCTFLFKKDSSQITRTMGTIPGPQSTQCDTITIPVSDFPSKGIWSLNVNYSSDLSSGTSAAQNVEVK